MSVTNGVTNVYKRIQSMGDGVGRRRLGWVGRVVFAVWWVGGREVCGWVNGTAFLTGWEKAECEILIHEKN